MNVRFLASALTLAFLGSAVPSRADDAPGSLEEMAPSRSTPGWSRQTSSLLLYGSDGALAQELPLRAPDDASIGTITHETLGNVSPDGSMAWTLDRRLIWDIKREKVIESHRQLRVFGGAGAELWRDEEVDVPERGEPVLFSSDGKILLLSKRSDAGWSVEARTWLGQVVAAIGPFPRLISMALTPNGRYALARWGVPDKSDTHTFIDLIAKKRHDVPSSDLLLGLARIGDDGVARSGSKVVFAFDVAASSGVAVSTPAAGTPSASPR